jgi:hypothetical protein
MLQSVDESACCAEDVSCSCHGVRAARSLDDTGTWMTTGSPGAGNAMLTGGTWGYCIQGSTLWFSADTSDGEETIMATR